MIKAIKSYVHRVLARLGYRIVRVHSGLPDRLAGQVVVSKAPAELLAMLPEIIQGLQPDGLPPLEGYQREMAAYNLKTGMGDADADFYPLYELCRKFTMTSWERLYSVYSSVRYIVKANIPGDFVECGVWRGGSTMMAAHTLSAMGCADRHLYLFDTFEGLPKPDKDLDVDAWGNSGLDGWLPHRKSDESSDWAYASLDEVRANLVSTGYPMDRVSFVKGMVEDTLPDKAPEKIALLRLDTDWYSSTQHELKHLYPRLSRNGILIIDDYGHFLGARKATDEYFATLKAPPLLSRIDYAGRLAVKLE